VCDDRLNHLPGTWGASQRRVSSVSRDTWEDAILMLRARLSSIGKQYYAAQAGSEELQHDACMSLQCALDIDISTLGLGASQGFVMVWILHFATGWLLFAEGC